MQKMQVQNKAAAEVQITAEQLLLEAGERRMEATGPVRRMIQDEDELATEQAEKRHNFEEKVRRARSQLTFWMQYVTWEEEQGNIHVRIRIRECVAPREGEGGACGGCIYRRRHMHPRLCVLPLEHTVVAWSKQGPGTVAIVEVLC